MYNNGSMYFHSFRVRFFILLFCSVIPFPLDRLVYVQTVPDAILSALYFLIKNIML